MDKLSILLGLSGSEQSKFAADVAWSIARRAGGEVVAQHVVDTRLAWEILRNDKPGFVGSGVYVSAYENLVKSLRVIANALVNKFEAVAAGQAVPTEAVVDEGSPVRRMCERALHHDLVVIGHQHRDPSVKEQDHCNFIRYAVAEGLAHDCQRPLLVIQNQVVDWATMSILVSSDHLNFKFIGACIELASLLGLKPQIVALAGGTHEEAPEALLADMRTAHPELKDIEMTVQELRGLAVENKANLWRAENVDLDWAPEPDTLMVIPTRSSGGHRITVLGTSPDSFVRHLPLPTILLWPEEHTQFGVNRQAGKETASMR